MVKRNSEHPRLVMRVGLNKKLEHVVPWGEEMMMHYPLGADVEVQIYQRRSLEHTRLYWAVLHAIVDNTENKYGSAEDLHSAIKVALGYTHKIKLISGDTIILPGSIAFDKMDQAEFKVYFDRAMNELRKADYPVDKYIEEGKKKLAEIKPYYRGKNGRSKTPPGRNIGTEKEAA